MFTLNEREMNEIVTRLFNDLSLASSIVHHPAGKGILKDDIKSCCPKPEKCGTEGCPKPDDCVKQKTACTNRLWDKSVMPRTGQDENGNLVVKLVLPGVPAEKIEVRAYKGVIEVTIAEDKDNFEVLKYHIGTDYDLSKATVDLDLGVLTLVAPAVEHLSHTVLPINGKKAIEA